MTGEVFDIGAAVRELENAERRVMAVRAQITRAKAELVGFAPGTIALARIIEIAAIVCEVPQRDILSRRRDADMVRARHLFCLAAKRHTHKSYPQVGRFLGRDHTTVIHATRNAERMIASDPSWSDAYAEIERRLAG